MVSHLLPPPRIRFTQIYVKNTDPYWLEVSLIRAQLDGLLQGYNDKATPSRKLTKQQLDIINMDGDLEELMTKFGGRLTTPLPQKNFQ